MRSHSDGLPGKLGLTAIAVLAVTGLVLPYLGHSNLTEATLLAHITAGIISLPFIGFYLWKHASGLWSKERGTARGLAISGAGVLCLSILSGLALVVVFWVDTYVVDWMEPLHMYASIALFLLLPVHVLTSYPGRDELITTFQMRSLGFTTLILSLALTLFFGGLGAFDTPDKEVPKDYELSADGSLFYPSLTTTGNKKFYKREYVTGDKACNPCHAQIVEESLEGIHHFTGVDNLIVKTGYDPAHKGVGLRADRFCASCHEPAVLITGMATKSLVEVPEEYRKQGTTCLICHGIQEVDGKGGKVIAPPDPFGFFNTGSAFYDGLNRLLVRSFVDEHRKEMNPPLIRQAVHCTSCHNVNANEGFNGFGFFQLHDEFDEWFNTAFNSGVGPDKRHIRCQDCHMFLQDGSTDPVARRHGGKHRNHRIVAANTFVAKEYSTPEQMRLTEAYLQGTLERKEITDVVPPGPVVTLKITSPGQVKAGEPFEATVQLHNRAVGHTFPAGAIEVHDTWLEVLAKDQDGKVVFASGLVGENGDRDQSAFGLIARPVDRAGNEVFATGGLAVGFLYKNAILNGQSQQVSYTITPPATYQGPLTLSARLRYRRVDDQFRRLMYGEHPPEVPTTDLVSGTATITVSP